MTERKGKAEIIDVKALLGGDDAFNRTAVRAALQEVLEAEMTEAVGAAKVSGHAVLRVIFRPLADCVLTGRTESALPA